MSWSLTILKHWHQLTTCIFWADWLQMPIRNNATLSEKAMMCSSTSGRRCQGSLTSSPHCVLVRQQAAQHTLITPYQCGHVMQASWQESQQVVRNCTSCVRIFMRSNSCDSEELATHQLLAKGQEMVAKTSRQIGTATWDICCIPKQSKSN